MPKLSSQLPHLYHPNLPRVSSIVESVFPFEAEAKERFLDWLWRHNISHDDYMEEASSGGKYIHSAMETFILTGKFQGKKYKGYTSCGIDFLKNCAYTVVNTEKYIRCNKEGFEYQGTIDLVVQRKSDGKFGILDFKTYGLAKDKWNLQSSYKKPTSKLKKASLQLSLYAYAEELPIEFIGVIEIGDGYVKEHILPLWEEEKIEEVIKEYKSFNE